MVDNGQGSFLCYGSFQQTFRRICSLLGIKSSGVHALRHTFATRLIDRGVAPKIVSQLLGHSSVVFTLNRYVHTNEDSLRESIGVLNN